MRCASGRIYGSKCESWENNGPEDLYRVRWILPDEQPDGLIREILCCFACAEDLERQNKLGADGEPDLGSGDVEVDWMPAGKSTED